MLPGYLGSCRQFFTVPQAKYMPFIVCESQSDQSFPTTMLIINVEKETFTFTQYSGGYGVGVVMHTQVTDLYSLVIYTKYSPTKMHIKSFQWN